MIAVQVKPLRAIFFLLTRPGPVAAPFKDGLEIEEGVTVDVPGNLYEWPEGSERPMPVVGRDRSDAKRLKVFRHAREVEPADFQLTGLSFGGVLSPGTWERFAKTLPELMESMSTPDDPTPSSREPHDLGR